MIVPKTGAILFILVLTLLESVVYAQHDIQTPPVRLHDQNFRNQLYLYNGKEYIEFPNPYDGSPIYLDDMWNKGMVMYNDQTYFDLDLFYDIFQDVLVIEHSNVQGTPVYFTPDNSRISWFTLDGDKFMIFPVETREQFGMPKGFYQEIFTEPFGFYVKRKAELYEVHQDQRVMPTFRIRDRYFVVIDEIFYEVKNKRSLKKIMPSLRREISDFSREQVLYFNRENKDRSIQLLLNHLRGIYKQEEGI